MTYVGGLRTLPALRYATLRYGTLRYGGYVCYGHLACAPYVTEVTREEDVG